mmetsp:Transcript_10355/g.11401  ORF Transcript_10355/g.11401 Transcript_10355/m.11401 type:complete len:178 (-) Transcript_10355:84-617(-)
MKDSVVNKSNVEKKKKPKEIPDKIIHLDSCFATANSPETTGLSRTLKNMELPSGINYSKAISILKETIEYWATQPNPPKAILVEGFLLYSGPELVELLDKKIFLKVAKDVSYTRRLNRKTRKNKELFDQYFEKYVWPEYLVHNAHIEDIPGIQIFDGTLSADDIFNKAIEFINKQQE